MSEAESKPTGIFSNMSVMFFFIFFTWEAWFTGIGRFMTKAT